MTDDDEFVPDFAPSSRWRCHLCLGPNCTGRGSAALLPALERAIREAGIGADVEVTGASCRDRCGFGPCMNVYPGPALYNALDEERIHRIVREHLGGGRPVVEFMRLEPPARPAVRSERGGRT